MAENKGMLLAKSVQKHAGRAKEKLLQNLGKVDRTADEIFDEHLTNFTRQQNSATRLQKEFNNYIRCVRAVQSASKSLMDAINEVYESQWTGSEALYAQTNTVEVLFQDFSHKLGDQVLIPLNTYTAQFPEMRKKIDKRGRKLVDYDSQRHSFQSLQANAAKRKDDVKITKGREQLEEAKRTYEVLNTELHDELPALHDSRILFLVTNLQTLFASEQQFHSETSKVYAELEAIVDKLATESQRGSYTLKKITANSSPSSQPQSPVKANLSIVNNISNGSANANGPTSTSPSISPSSEQHMDDSEPSYQNTEIVKSASAALRSSANTTTTTTTTTTTATNNNNIDVPSQPVAPPKSPVPPSSEKVTTNGTDHDHDTSSSSHTQNNTPATIAADSTTSPSSTTSAPALPTTTAPVVAEVQPSTSRSPSPTTPTVAGAAVSQSSNTNVNKLNPNLGHSFETNIFHQQYSNIRQQPHAHQPHFNHHQHHHHHNHHTANTGDPSSLTSTSSTASSSEQHGFAVSRHYDMLPSKQGANEIHLYSNVVANSGCTLNKLNNINNNVNNNGSTTTSNTSTFHNNNNSKLEELYDIPVGATTTDLPPGVLYRVKATYKYVREDVDELSFEVGDTINVIEYEDPEDQEEGWLMGIKEGTNDKGMFPANFTRPL
ncbi:myc box-dependent-interacting protein 1 isoform X2 [Wyeomyia smithii]|uniref:myc box-dependent-interacting protein 1 isoform X2 n=1 Tax=Wyeomyia smithii TaxID=174621 RepID=UPI002467C647|nr:myc box-dependent-interacting protein 1 isoform X2 [Wyeomyia smithii]